MSDSIFSVLLLTDYRAPVRRRITVRHADYLSQSVSAITAILIWSYHVFTSDILEHVSQFFKRYAR